MVFLKQYIQDLMNDRRSDPLSQITKFLLLVISYIYATLIKGHHFFYKVNLLKSHKPEIPTISIGNITLGGTGKTPFAIMLAQHLTEKKKKTAVLIRGYGEDEWKLLEDRLKGFGVKIFVGRDRVKSAGEASRNGFESLILDDGFQHRRLARNLDIVLLDSTNPFGNKHLFPRGILREPLAGLKRADIVVLTKVDKGRNNVYGIIDTTDKIAPGKTIIKAVHSPKNLFDIQKEQEFELSFLKDEKVCVLSAICDPSYFKYTVEKVGMRAGLEFAFPDHYAYKVCDLEHVFKECEQKNISTVITTEKDAVKLKGLTEDFGDLRNHQILALAIELEITEGIEKFNDVLHRLYMRDSG